MTPATSSTSASDPAASGPDAAPKPAATARQVAGALGAVLLALVLLDQAYGLLMDHAFRRSSFNPVAQVLHAGAETVVVGASGGKYAFDPAVIGGRSYNIAENGQSGFYAVAALNALPAGSIRQIVFALDTGDIAYGLDGPNLKHLARFAPWVKSDPQMRGWLGASSPRRRLLLLSGFYRFRGIGGAVLREWQRPRWSTTGYEPLDHVMQVKPTAGDAAAAGPALQPSASGLALLDALAAATRRHQARLVIAIPPIYGQNHGLSPAHALLLEAMRARLAGLPLCDLTPVRDIRIDAIHATPRFFGDGAHLNGAGGQAFSAAVATLAREHCGWDLARP